MGQPWIIAHKGGQEVAPAGSLGAFEDALRLGCDGVELDVRRLGDGTLVVLHDEVVNNQPLSQLTAPRCVGLDDHPPLLEQVLSLVGEEQMCNVEIKEAGYEQEIVALARRFLPTERLLFSSFLDNVVITLRAIGDKLRTGLIVGRAAEPDPSELDLTTRIATSAATFICLRATLIPYRMLDRIYRPVLVWTVNDEQLMIDLLTDTRVAGIITDFPHRALALRNRLAAHPRSR